MSIRRNLRNGTALGATLAAVLLGLVLPSTAQAAADAQPSGSPSAAAKPTQTQNPEAITVETVVVTGERGIPGGLMKVQTAAETMSSITSEAIQEQAPAVSPLQMAATIPGFNFGSTDSTGLSNRDWVSLRGLDQTEIGWMIEGVPGVNPIVYYPYLETWADNENISDITVTPGNSRLQDPIVSASGGEFIESIRSPRDSFGGMVTGTGGTSDVYRGFVDIDTGYIEQTGAKAFLSYSYTSGGNWVAPGTDTRDHVDFKVTEDWSSRAHSSLFVSYNNWVNGAREAIISLAQFNNGIATNLTQYQNSRVYAPGVSNAYNPLAAAPLINYLVASNNDVDLTDQITLHVTPYFRYGTINSPGEAALSPTTLYAGNELVTPAYPSSALQCAVSVVPPCTSANGKVMAQADTLLDYTQAGVSAYLEANLTPDNLLMVGYWHEDQHQSEVSYYMPANSAGEAADPNESAALHGTNGALITGINFATGVTTDEIYISDTQSFLDDKLHISAGIKDMFYSVHGVDKAIGAPPTFSANWNVPMPRLLVSYDIDDDSQIYANSTTNARMPNVSATYVTEYSTTSGAISQIGAPATKPEYTMGEQIGYRYHGVVNLDVAAFYMNLADRQIATGTLVNGTLLNSAVSAGAETIKGMSLEVSTHSYDGFSVYGDVQYLEGTFSDNIPVNGDFLPTKGKQMVESPNWVSSIGARYEIGPFFAEFTGKYVSSQYSTFLDNQTIPSYTVANVALGYHLPDFGAANDPVLRVNLSNLGNKPYFTPDTFATTAVATHGINGTAIAAGTPLGYVTAPLAVMVSLSSKF
jgi:iron complex outermembrane recepter protein